MKHHAIQQAWFSGLGVCVCVCGKVCARMGVRLLALGKVLLLGRAELVVAGDAEDLAHRGNLLLDVEKGLLLVDLLRGNSTRKEEMVFRTDERRAAREQMQDMGTHYTSPRPTLRFLSTPPSSTLHHRICAVSDLGDGLHGGDGGAHVVVGPDDQGDAELAEVVSGRLVVLGGHNHLSRKKQGANERR